MSKKSILWGIVLVLAGVYLLISQMGLVPQLPFFTVVFTVLFVYTAVQGIFKKSFTMTLVSVALLGCVYDEYLKIEAITPWPLIIAALLVGIGLDLIFKNVFRKKNNYNTNVNFGNACGHNGNYAPNIENIQDGEFVKESNSFGEINLYFPKTWRIEVKQSSSFGDIKFHGMASVSPDSPCVYLDAECGFGDINIYSE